MASSVIVNDVVAKSSPPAMFLESTLVEVA